LDFVVIVVVAETLGRSNRSNTESSSLSSYMTSTWFLLQIPTSGGGGCMRWDVAVRNG
jgi:hypothetical protein